jgi:hypothetical protein
MKAGLTAIGEGAKAGLEAVADKALETVAQIAEQTVAGSAISRRKEVLPELLGPLYTAELQHRLDSCKTVEQLFPVRAQEAVPTVADAASMFVTTPRASADDPIQEASNTWERVLQGEVYGTEVIEASWLTGLQMDASAQLPGFVKHLLAAAAVLQGSSELAAAGSLPHNARLPPVLQRCATAQVAHYITAADILGMPRQDLPALVAALCAAEVCMGLIACTGELGGPRTNVQPVGANTRGDQSGVAEPVSKYLHSNAQVTRCHGFIVSRCGALRGILSYHICQGWCHDVPAMVK